MARSIQILQPLLATTTKPWSSEQCQAAGSQTCAGAEFLFLVTTWKLVMICPCSAKLRKLPGQQLLRGSISSPRCRAYLILIIMVSCRIAQEKQFNDRICLRQRTGSAAADTRMAYSPTAFSKRRVPPPNLAVCTVRSQDTLKEAKSLSA